MPRISRSTKIIVIGGVLFLVALAFAADYYLRVCCGPPIPPAR
jgi:hypothetical protein